MPENKLIGLPKKKIFVRTVADPDPDLELQFHKKCYRKCIISDLEASVAGPDSGQDPDR